MHKTDNLPFSTSLIFCWLVGHFIKLLVLAGTSLRLVLETPLDQELTRGRLWAGRNEMLIRNVGHTYACNFGVGRDAYYLLQHCTISGVFTQSNLPVTHNLTHG